MCGKPGWSMEKRYGKAVWKSSMEKRYRKRGVEKGIEKENRRVVENWAEV